VAQSAACSTLLDAQTTFRAIDALPAGVVDSRGLSRNEQRIQFRR
jgi:hypothetical protein